MNFSRCCAALLLLGGAAIADETVMEVIDLQNRPAAEIQPLLIPLLETDDRVIDNGFSLIVKTSPQRLEDIRALIKKLDTQQQNLTISVLQNSHKTAAELNAEAAIAISPSAVRMTGMVGDTRDLDSHHSMQHLRTLDGQPTHIQVGQQRPVETIGVYNSGYGYPSVSVNTQFQEASTGFAAIPRLIGNREVIIDIEPWSDRFLSGGAVASEGAHTSIRARLGEWIEIAGSGIANQQDNRGYGGFNHRTDDEDLRILIKVDLAN